MSNSQTFELMNTSSLSFQVKVGTRLQVRRLDARKKGRPSVVSRLQKAAYIVYSGIAKVGQISNDDIASFSGDLPSSCTVTLVDPLAGVIKITFANGPHNKAPL